MAIYFGVRRRARDLTRCQLAELVDDLDAAPDLSRGQAWELRALRAELRRRGMRHRSGRYGHAAVATGSAVTSPEPSARCEGVKPMDVEVVG